MKYKLTSCFLVSVEAFQRQEPFLNGEVAVLCQTLSEAEEAGHQLIASQSEKYIVPKEDFRIAAIRQLPDVYVKC